MLNPTAEGHDPGNYMGRIDHLWAALSLDDGGEGLVAATIGSMTMPMVAADKRRLDLFMPHIRQIARTFKKPIRIAKFSTRQDIEIIQP